MATFTEGQRVRTAGSYLGDETLGNQEGVLEMIDGRLMVNFSAGKRGRPKRREVNEAELTIVQSADETETL